MNTRLHQMLLCVCIGIGAISTLFYLGFQSSVRDYLKVIGQSGAERSDSAVNRTPVLHNADRIVADLRSKRIIVAIGTSRQPERIEADDLRATFSLEEARSISKLASVTEVRIRKSFVVPKGESENLQFELGDDSLKVLSTLPNLKILAVSSNQITDDGIAFLSSMKSLRELQIQSDSVSGKGILTLSKLANLERLTLYLSDDAATSVNALAKQLPECEIEIYNPSTGELEAVRE